MILDRPASCTSRHPPFEEETSRKMRTTSESSFAERRSNTDRRQRGRISTDALHLLVEQMADGVLVVERDGIIRFANPAAAALFGRTVHDLKGRSFGFPVMAGDSAEVELLRPGGEVVAVELRAVDFDWQGRLASLVSLRDVTDRKCLEQERIARARAEAASRAKSDFLTLMSHELRTPLNAVIGYAELLMVEEADPITPEQHSRLARILDSAKHLRDLVDEMLDLAEVGEGRLALGRALAPAARPASQALDEARADAEAHGVSLSSTCAVADGVSFTGDERRVKQILSLLLDNAIKFTPRGGTVTLSCDRVSTLPPNTQLRGTGAWACWRVRDSGIGIAPEQQALIFEAFVQVDTGHTRAQGGSGLGLTIGRSLARLMKGDLTVESEPGRGSTFTLWLPGG
jgi:signal transduction histidine kinase